MPATPGEQTPTVAQLEHDVLTVRADQRAQQHLLEDAVSCELRALGAVDSARAVQARCRLKIEEDAQAICSLQDEIAAIFPAQRKPHSR